MCFLPTPGVSMFFNYIADFMKTQTSVHTGLVLREDIWTCPKTAGFSGTKLLYLCSTKMAGMAVWPNGCALVIITLPDIMWS